MLLHRALSALPLAALAYSSPLIGRNPQCVTGSLQCCQSVQSASSPAVAGLLAGLPNIADDLQVGLQCSLLAGAGSGAKCEAQPVCCNDTNYNGLVNVGCSPVDL